MNSAETSKQDTPDKATNTRTISPRTNMAAPAHWMNGIAIAIGPRSNRKCAATGKRAGLVPGRKFKDSIRYGWDRVRGRKAA